MKWTNCPRLGIVQLKGHYVKIIHITIEFAEYKW